MAPIIRVRKLVKDYDSRTRAVDGVSLDIMKGEWTALTGPSGSGKTTLLNMIGCLDSPTSGMLKIDGVDVTRLDQKALTIFRGENIGLIFQQYHLVPYLTALENVMMAQYFYGYTDEKEAEEMLTAVGLGHRLDHVPAHLSGGEQQRVCIARALVNEPEILLADEPTGNLDQRNGDIVLELMRKLKSEGHTIVMVTHNPDIAKMGDRIIKLVDGRIAYDSNDGGISPAAAKRMGVPKGMVADV